jgi:hypothetical protein
MNIEAPVKIGVSKHPEKRLKDLQTSNPYRLKLIGKHMAQNERAAYAIEKKTHKAFKKYRRSGEWFFNAPVDEIQKYIHKKCYKFDTFSNDIVPMDLDDAYLNTIRGIYD